MAFDLHLAVNLIQPDTQSFLDRLLAARRHDLVCFVITAGRDHLDQEETSDS